MREKYLLENKWIHFYRHDFDLKLKYLLGDEYVRTDITYYLLNKVVYSDQVKYKIKCAQ